MLFSAMGSLGDRLDSKFITAYFFPAFIGVLGSIWILVLSVGAERFVDRIGDFDSVEQALGAGVVVLVTIMTAQMFKSLERPIASFYAGHAFPGPMRAWAIQGQQKARIRQRTAVRLAGQASQLYPRDTAETQPTAFGNILAATADYPRLVYAMDAYYWWPRLMPILPLDFQELLLATQTPMRGMLNLSVVFLYLAALGVVVLGLLGGQLIPGLVVALVGIVLAHLCYRAALVQAAELARTIWVGFDLYRYEILGRLHVEEPKDLDAERVLWQRFAKRLNDLDIPVEAANIAGRASAPASAPRPTHESA